METILQNIVRNKRIEIERQKEVITIDTLTDSERMNRTPISMKAALTASDTGIIAEFKRRSPSKGWIYADAQAVEVTKAYELNGASALSVLTDQTFFGGSPADLNAARENVNIPLLRKEFILDEYQIYQSRAMGADAILLIAALLSPDTCLKFTYLAHQLGMEVLLELHGAHELEHAATGADMIGINNRNLDTFETRVEHSFELIGQLPAGAVYVSESGLSDTATVRSLRAAGFNGFLMGETFMRQEQPGKALGQFIHQLKNGL